jgi:hypothetical protein
MPKKTKPSRPKPRDPQAGKMSGARWTTVTTLLRIAVAIEDIETRLTTIEGNVGKLAAGVDHIVAALEIRS